MKRAHTAIKGEIEVIMNNDAPALDALELAILQRQLEAGVIPLIEVTLADERVWCRHVLAGDAAGAATCDQLRGGRCALVGDRGCAFDEPDDAPVWQKVAAYKESVRKLGVDYGE